MGEWSIYIFPTSTDEKAGFCERAVARLAQAGLVTPPTRALQNLDERSPGENAAAFLAEGFDYLGVRMGERPKLIPEDPAILPRCPTCAEDLADPWYDVLNDEIGRDLDQDWTTPQVTCPTCRWKGSLLDVVDEAGVGAYARREFIFLSDVYPTGDEELDALEGRLKQLLGDVEVAVYSYT
jgi:hypothetical protein